MLPHYSLSAASSAWKIPAVIETIQIGIETLFVPPRSVKILSTTRCVTFVVICIFGAELLSFVQPQTVAYSNRENNYSLGLILSAILAYIQNQCDLSDYLHAYF